MTAVHKFGRNPDIDAGTPETVWSAGGYLTWPTTAGKVTVASSGDNAADDTVDGTGLRTMVMNGLNADWEPISETITLNGTSNVETTNDFFRVFRMKGLTTGSGGVNAGTITATLGGNTIAEIEEGMGQTQLAFYSTPAARELQIYRIFVSAFKSAAGAYEVRMMTREDDNASGDSLACWNLKGTFGGHTQASPSTREYGPRKPFIVPPKTDIEFIGEVSANNTGISVEFTGELCYP